MQRRTLITAAAASTFGMALPTARADGQPTGRLINLAGRQRMLSQRMAKAWLALTADVMPERAQAVLDESAALFEQQLATLRAFDGGPAVQATYHQLEGAWAEFRQRLRGAHATPTATVLQADARVLALAHQGTQQLEALSRQPTGRLINLAGRQRMLSQRMAKFRLADARPAPGVDTQAQIRQARGEFIAALDVLEQAPQATRAIRDEIALARGQWVFFDMALSRPGQPGARDAAELFVTSERLLQVMERVTGLYTRLGA